MGRLTGAGAGRRGASAAALLALCVTAALVVSAAHDRADAASRPTLRITSFSADRTINPGRTASVTPFCRRGFSFLASRFRPISVNPSTASPRFDTQAIIPRPKGATFVFRNTGTAVVTIRATADCTRITGQPSLRTIVVGRAAQLAARAASTGQAHASARRRLAVICGRRNSIPADIGFEARRNDLVRLAFFRNRRGRIGIRGVFSGNRAERVKLYLSCVQGRGVAMAGRLSGGRRRARGSPASLQATSSTRRPKIIVRYYKTRTRTVSGLPLGDLFTEVDRRARVPWGSPMPSSIPVGDLLAGRGFFDLRQALASGAVPLAGAVPEKGRSFFSRLPPELGFIVGLALHGSELAATAHLLVADRRDFDRIIEQVGGGPPPPAEETPTSKTVGPFSGLPDCGGLGFFIDVYIPADAKEPITHQILDNDPPCQNATVSFQKFDKGEFPPGTPAGETRWQDHKTYRVTISGDAGPPAPFRIKVTWTLP